MDENRENFRTAICDAVRAAAVGLAIIAGLLALAFINGAQ